MKTDPYWKPKRGESTPIGKLNLFEKEQHLSLMTETTTQLGIYLNSNRSELKRNECDAIIYMIQDNQRLIKELTNILNKENATIGGLALNTVTRSLNINFRKS